MREYKKTFESIFEDALNYYPTVMNRVVNWFPSGQREITVKTDEGKIYAFNGNEKSIRQLRPITEEECVDDERWRKEFAMRLYKKLYMSPHNQVSLAEESGISPITISNYINGKATPSGYNLYRLARALRCTISDLTDF